MPHLVYIYVTGISRLYVADIDNVVYNMMYDVPDIKLYTTTRNFLNNIYTEHKLSMQTAWLFLCQSCAFHLRKLLELSCMFVAVVTILILLLHVKLNYGLIFSCQNQLSCYNCNYNACVCLVFMWYWL